MNHITPTNFLYIRTGLAALLFLLAAPAFGQVDSSNTQKEPSRVTWPDLPPDIAQEIEEREASLFEALVAVGPQTSRHEIATQIERADYIHKQRLRYQGKYWYEVATAEWVLLSLKRMYEFTDVERKEWQAIEDQISTQSEHLNINKISQTSDKEILTNAMRELKRAYADLAALLGPEHPRCIGYAFVVGLVQTMIGESEAGIEALQGLVRSLSGILSNGRPDAFGSVFMSNMYATLGEYELAQEVMEKALSDHFAVVSEVFPYLTPSQKWAYFEYGPWSAERNLASTLAFENDQVDPKSGLASTLLSKNILNDAVQWENRTISGKIHGEVMGEWKEYKRLRKQYAATAFRQLDLKQPDDKSYDDILSENVWQLHQDLEELENKIRASQGTSELLLQKPVPKLEHIQSALRSEDALLEFVEYASIADKMQDGQTKYDYSPNRYGVFIFVADGSAQAVELGEKHEIDLLIGHLRQGFDEYAAHWERNAKKTPTPEELRHQTDENRIFPGPLTETLTARWSSKLREAIWDPLAAHLDGVKRVYVAPDGELAKIPFEALATRSENSWKYLVEELEIVYLDTGRDLQRFVTTEDTPINNEAIIVANPAFSASPQQLVARMVRDSTNFKPATSTAHTTPLPTDHENSLMGSATSIEIPKNLSPLREFDEFLVKATDRLEKHTSSITMLTDDDATEENVMAITSPRLLQFITHGFVMNAKEVEKIIGWKNPLLSSMLFLAGRNTWTPQDAEYFVVNGNVEAEGSPKLTGMAAADIEKARRQLADGVLTAYEVAGMDLSGTELVNLTACETGLGEIHSEGVSGLRSAFIAAGARSLTMSLWKIPENHTARQMDDFYELWLSEEKGGEFRYKAFRASQLAALDRARKRANTPWSELDKRSQQERQMGRDMNAHPFYWAGTVYFGDPGDLP